MPRHEHPPTENRPVSTTTPPKALALLLLSASWLPAADEPARPAPATIEVPGGFAAARIDGDRLLALAGDELRAVDLRTRKVETVVRFPQGQTPRVLDVAGGQAAVAARDK